jgi:hypothetical protein
VGFAVAREARPPIEALDPYVVGFAGAGGGAMDALPVVLSLDFVLESDVLAVVAGVPVRGVDAAELADEICFVGDLVGDLVRLSVAISSGQICNLPSATIWMYQ